MQPYNQKLFETNDNIMPSKHKLDCTLTKIASTTIGQKKILKFLLSSLLIIVYGKQKKNASQISNFPMVLHPKPLVRAIGPVECWCPAT